MWRVHRNRVDSGKGATLKGSGFHESMGQDHNLILPNASLTTEMIVDGAIMDAHFDNPFLRWHESFEKYSSFLSDMDDLPIHETDDFERLKQGKAKKKDVVGVTPITARQDSDEIFEFYDAITKTLKQLHGSFALGIIFKDMPDLIIGARRGSPLAVGYGPMKII